MNANKRITTWVLSGLVVVALSLSSCTTDYVTGKRTFSLVSESQEVALGQEADPGIVAEYGLYNDPDLTAYIDRIGQATVKVSHRPNLAYTFRVIDSPIVNAFALPGGYVYITRGILAHFNSEDELAGVIGHEAGHVVARHSAEQMSRQQLAGLGLGLGVLLSDDFAKFANLAATGLGLMFLSFSRDQESESDKLGVEYSTRLGYDAHDMANFFRTIGRLSAQSGQSLPNFLSTHPDPANREATVHQLADQYQTELDYKPLNVTRRAYLDRVEGIVYGENPRQGFVENDTFYHPDMRFQFPIPVGWKVNNTASSVQIVEPDGNAAIRFTLATGATPKEAAAEFVSKNNPTIIDQQQTRVYGYPAYLLVTQFVSDSQTLKVVSHFIEKDEHIFVFHGFSLAADYNTYAPTLIATAMGFRDVRDEDILNRQPKRLRIVEVEKAGSLRAVLQSAGMESDKLDELAIINGMELDGDVARGELVKVIGE